MFWAKRLPAVCVDVCGVDETVGFCPGERLAAGGRGGGAEDEGGEAKAREGGRGAGAEVRGGREEGGAAGERVTLQRRPLLSGSDRCAHA
eukprot:2131269-Rhodomonas_salina.3